jgi:hypothetical protein
MGALPPNPRAEAPPAHVAPAVPVRPEPEPIGLEPEITSPSRRYMPPPEPDEPIVRPPSRTRYGVALVAVLLAAAGTYLGFRNGWFGAVSPTPPVPSVVPTAPATVGVAPPVVPTVATAPTSTGVNTAATAASPVTTGAAPTESVAATAATVAPTANANTPPPVPTGAPSAAPTADGDGTNLQATRGYLVVDSPTPQAVYNGGVFIGLTGQKLELDCGIKYLRLGVPPEGGVARPNSITWTSEGKSANLVCKAITRVAITPTK